MFNEILEEVARALTGEAVKVRRVKNLNNRLGECYKKDGIFYIDILDRGVYAGLLNVFLHECAHIAIDKDRYIDLSSSGGFSSGLSCLSGEEVEEIEESAEKLAQAWLRFANKHAWRFSGSDGLKKLQALLNIEVLTSKS